MSDEGASSRSIFDLSQSLRTQLERLIGSRPGIAAGTPLNLCLEAPRHAGRPLVLLRGEGPRPADTSVCVRCPLWRGEPRAEWTSLPCHPTTTVHIGGPTAGIVGYHGPRREASKFRPWLELAGRAVRDLLQRRRLSQRFHRRFGRTPWLLGPSPELHRLDTFLEHASRTALPVLLSGERGTGKGDAARLLHLASERAARPFVHLDLSVLSRSSWDEETRRALERARQGTLYLESVDAPHPAVQVGLAELLSRGYGEARLVASAARPISPDGSGGALHATLWRELAFLTFDLPPLRSRPDDVDCLSRHFLRQYSRRQQELSPPVRELLRIHPWPGNIPELRHVMARLAALAQTTVLTPEQIQRHAPELLSDRSTEAAKRGREGSLDELIRRCARGAVDTGDLPRRLHPVLERALRTVARRCVEPLSLNDLALEAHSSPSHLSHLVKETLGISPMAFLARVRIERARRRLLSEPGTLISEIAAGTGFEELRTFERTFKRQFGVSPQEYRRRRVV